MNEKELNEGCGEEYDSNIKTSLGLKKIKICGTSGFCPICKAQLKTLQERNAEVKQAIDEIKDWRGYPPDIIKQKLGLESE